MTPDESNPEQLPPAIEPAIETSPAIHPRPAPIGDRRIWACALAAGIAAGLVSWLVGESVREAFKPRLFKVQVVLQTFIQPTTESQNAADYKNAVLAAGLMGGLLALALGGAGGLAARSASHAGIAGLGGAALGALLATTAALGALRLFFLRHVSDPNDLVTPVLAHGAIGLVIGAVGGLALAVGLGQLRSIPNAIVGGCVGALLAALIVVILTTVLVPDNDPSRPLPDSSLARLIARLVPCLFVAVGAARGVQGRPATKVPLPLAQEV